MVCFSDIVDKLQLLTDERQLIPNIINLQFTVNKPCYQCDTKKVIFISQTYQNMATCDNDKKRFNSLAILNFHKRETDRIDLVSVENDFMAKHHERYSTFGKFSESDFV